MDERRHARLGLVIVLVGFAGFLAWAGLAPLDQGVAVPAKVMVAGNRKAVQPSEGGRIERILVGEGDAVAAGEVLVHMAQDALRAEADGIRVQWLGAMATAARLRAESAGETRIEFPEALRDSDDPRVPMMLELQRQLLDKRRRALEAEIEGIRESIAGNRARLSGIAAARASKSRQRELLEEQIEGLAGLVAEGYVARNRFLERQRELQRLAGELAEDRARATGIRRTIGELEARARQRRESHHREVRDRLAEVSVRVDELRARLDGLESRLSRGRVRAPAAGRVVGMRVFTEGGVVEAGETLMEIVPQERPLLVEGRAPVSLADKLEPGLPVALLFTAFELSDTPRLAGEVTQVSADRLVDERTGEPYYSIRVRVAPGEMARLRGRRIRPGMPVEAFVRTGERSLLNYLFKPLLDRMHPVLAEG